MSTTIVLGEARPDEGAGLEALRGYVGEVVGRMNGRPATPEDIDTFMSAGETAALLPPDGVFLLATDPDGAPAGCVGLRYRGTGVPDDAVEIKRMWTAEVARGQGLGHRLLSEALDRARDTGAARVVLDTRADLIEARTLYERTGFVEVEPYNDNPYAQVWYALDLG